jgi:hypothetical protein
MPLKWRVATLLDLVSHENTHATGKISYDFTPDVVRVDMGYSTIIQTPNFTHNIASLFNEGVTELIAQRVSREYLIGYPMRLEDGSVLDLESYEYFLNAYHLEHGTSKDYDAAREFVRSLCIHIATIRDISSESIENAFIAGYFRGTEEFFQDPNFLDVVLGNGFSQQLRLARSADDLKGIVRDYKMPVVTPVIQERIERALRELAKTQ